MEASRANLKPDTEPCEGCGGRTCTSCDEHLPADKKTCPGCDADTLYSAGKMSRHTYEGILKALGRVEARFSGCPNCSKGARACNDYCSRCETADQLSESLHQRSHGPGSF